MDYKNIGTSDEKSLYNYASYVIFAGWVLGVINLLIFIATLVGKDVDADIEFLKDAIWSVILGYVTAAFIKVFANISLRLKSIEEQLQDRKVDIKNSVISSVDSTPQVTIADSSETEESSSETEESQKDPKFEIGQKVALRITGTSFVIDDIIIENDKIWYYNKKWNNRFRESEIVESK